ncbi:MAG TPA: hypothetical protein VLI92_00945 [Candidatus Saccharimonadales bacterium]|nr:hypothetical protein [Candidatus Saccharimonadales bacterium]
MPNTMQSESASETEKDHYEQTIMKAHDFISSEGFTPIKIKDVIARAYEEMNKPEKHTQRVDVMVTTAEIIGQSLSKADNPDTLQEYGIVTHVLRSLSPENKAIARMCVRVADDQAERYGVYQTPAATAQLMALLS